MTTLVSFASTVLIDRQSQTVTKVYTPSKAIRALYWLAFQSDYPYSSNLAALIAAKYRREVAAHLTRHHFGREVVAPIVDITPVGSWFGLRSHVVTGGAAVRDAESSRFLRDVEEFFNSVGLPVWQIDPRSPSAYGNLINTPDGFKIIDLESGVPSPTPISGSWRRTIEVGAIPMFDDVDFNKVKEYIQANEGPLNNSLSAEGVSQLRLDVDSLELATRLWKSEERRLWGRSLMWMYKQIKKSRHSMVSGK